MYRASTFSALQLPAARRKTSVKVERRGKGDPGQPCGRTTVVHTHLEFGSYADLWAVGDVLALCNDLCAGPSPVVIPCPPHTYAVRTSLKTLV